MTHIKVGNHMKLNARPELRDRLCTFYGSLLGGRLVAGPSADFDLFEFSDGSVIGLYYGDPAAVLTADEQLKAAWLELKTNDPDGLRRKLLDFGVRQIDYRDTTRFYFQDPAGQVWRVAALGGGI